MLYVTEWMIWIFIPYKKNGPNIYPVNGFLQLFKSSSKTVNDGNHESKPIVCIGQNHFITVTILTNYSTDNRKIY